MARAPKKKTPDPSKQVERLRKRIDAVDAKLLELLAQRGALVSDVGKIKRDANTAFHAPARERELLERITKKNKGPYSDGMVETIFREIMSASLALESPLTVAFSADSPKSARAAIRRQFGRSARARREPTVADALTAVETGWADYAVVLIEDSVDGFHGSSVDVLADAGSHISGEIVLTTGGRNERFLIAGGDPPARTDNDRTSVIFVVRNEPGGLLQLLSIFSGHDVNLTCIESRPLPGQPWQYRFFVDLDGHATDDGLSSALAALGDRGSVFRVLGSYPKSP